MRVPYDAVMSTPDNIFMVLDGTIRKVSECERCHQLTGEYVIEESKCICTKCKKEEDKKDDIQNAGGSIKGRQDSGNRERRTFRWRNSNESINGQVVQGQI